MQLREDIPNFLRMSADAQLQANKAQVEAAGLAAPIVAKAALETGKAGIGAQTAEHPYV